MKKNSPIYQGSHFHKTGISLSWDVFFPYKHFVPICRDVFGNKEYVWINIFKDCGKTFDQKRNENGSQINKLLTNIK